MRAFNRSASCDFLDAACLKSLRGVGNYSDRHRLGCLAGSALLTRGSFEGGANPTNSGLFRRVRDLLETTHCMQTAARRTSVQRDNFRDALLPLATAARV